MYFILDIQYFRNQSYRQLIVKASTRLALLWPRFPPVIHQSVVTWILQCHKHDLYVHGL